MPRRHRLWAVAGLLIGRYGEHASAEANEKAAAAGRVGDDEARSIWTATRDALERGGRNDASRSE